VSRYSKCYKPHNTKHHREKVWYCKENMKMNSPRLAMKEDKSCSYVSSNASIAKETIKQTVTSVLIGITVSTKSDTVENNRNSAKVEYSNVAILSSLGVDLFFLFFSFYFIFLFNLHVVCLQIYSYSILMGDQHGKRKRKEKKKKEQKENKISLC